MTTTALIPSFPLVKNRLYQQYLGEPYTDAFLQYLQIQTDKLIEIKKSLDIIYNMGDVFKMEDEWIERSATSLYGIGRIHSVKPGFEDVYDLGEYDVMLYDARAGFQNLEGLLYKLYIGWNIIRYNDDVLYNVFVLLNRICYFIEVKLNELTIDWASDTNNRTTTIGMPKNTNSVVLEFLYLSNQLSMPLNIKYVLTTI